MKFFFDARHIRTDYHDGLSRYSFELAKEVAAQTPVTFLIHDPKQKAMLPAESETLIIHSPTSILEPFTAFRLNAHHPDVVFSPLQSIGSLGRRYRLILTQQDMTYYEYKTPPAFLPWYARILWRLYHLNYIPGRITLNAADMVATVSETSKQLIENTNLTKRPIIVVSNAVKDLSSYLSSPVVPTENLVQHLVYMGALLPHKNPETLIAMMKHLPGRTLHLLSRVSAQRQSELEALVPESARVIFHNGVSDKQYAELLAHNAAAVSASLSEGFGLPLAEALGLGVPAVVSDIAIFHEVAGGGALYAESKNPSDFAKKVIELDDVETRERIAVAAKKHISKFSWKASARVLVRAAKELASL